MSTYQEEIFNYLTKKDNFFSAYEIHQLFPEVKNTLIEQFWLTVKSSLEELAKETDWELKMSDKIFEKFSSLIIWTDESFGVAFEELHEKTCYGLWVNFDNKNLDRAQIDKYAENIEGIKGMTKNNYWLGWAPTGANFDNTETLKKILPEYRNDYAQELANQLFELHDDLQDDILKMSKMTKK